MAGKEKSYDKERPLRTNEGQVLGVDLEFSSRCYFIAIFIHNGPNGDLHLKDNLMIFDV